MFKEYKGRMVTIMSCSNCNVKCKHCYISYTGNFSGQQLFDLITNLKDKHEIMINGTEPLLHRDFLKCYKLCGYKSPITNGLVFKDNYDYIDELKSNGIEELRISYHFDLHEEISQVDKCYLEDLFKIIREKGLKLCLMCSIASTNYKNIPQYCQKAVELGATSIKFTNFLNQGRAKSLNNDLILSKSQIEEFFDLLNQERKKYDKNILEIRRCGSFGNDVNHKSNFRCDSGVNNVCITPDLKVYPCVFLCKQGNEIGFYKNGKIYIDSEFKNDKKDCRAKRLLNSGMKS